MLVFKQLFTFLKCAVPMTNELSKGNVHECPLSKWKLDKANTFKIRKFSEAIANVHYQGILTEGQG